MDIVLNFFDSAPAWVAAVTAITALTPTKADDKILGFALKVLNFCAGNVLKNTNKDDK
jgi:hypothetical protein